jgi:hypothetical protein
MFGLGLRSGHHPSLDQLISSQLNQVGRPFVVGHAGRAGARSGDVWMLSWGRDRVGRAAALVLFARGRVVF